MQWIVGAVVLAFVAAVVSGRVPVAYVVYTFAALFFAMALALFFAFSRSKKHGLLLIGISYAASGALAILLTDWWPLVAGFAIAWALRAMGLDPGPEAVPEEQAQSSTNGDEKKS
jgi:hypothetical protein